MAYATATATRTITSVVSGTAVTGGNRARFTYTASTALTVGDIVVNTAFTAQAYNEASRVTASAASWYELSVLYTATGTGTGTVARVAVTGTEVLTGATAAPTGFTSTDRGNKRTFSSGTNSIQVDGTLTINADTCKVVNTGGTTAISVGAGRTLNITGRRSTAGDAPFPDEGLDWIWTGSGFRYCIRLDGTSSSRALINLYDTAIRFGSGYMGLFNLYYGTLTTYGDRCWILPGSATASRLRLETDDTAALNFTATKTFVGVWLNLSVNQTSLKGFTPLGCDGVEANATPITSVTTPVIIENYDTTYIVFVTHNAHITVYNGNWARLKNNLLGTNITSNLFTVTGSAHNVIDFSKGITATAITLDGSALSDGTLYWQPTGSNVSGIRPKGAVSDITYDLSLTKTTYADGTATADFIYAWQYNNVTTLHTSYRYFCTTTTRGAEKHVIWSSRYGYDKQSRNTDLFGNNNAALSFAHASLPTTSKVIADAAAITGIVINNAVTTLEISTGYVKTIQDLYDRYQYQLQQDASLFVVDSCVITGSIADFTGKTLSLGGIITGGNFTGVKFTTINILSGGTIAGLEVSGSKIAASSPALAQGITDCDFTRGTAGHGIEITGTAANITLSGNTFTGYAATNGSTGNEAIYVNIATGTMVISITNGGTIPSIRTAGCTVTVSSLANLTLNGFITGSDIVILNAGTITEIENVDAKVGTTHTKAIDSTVYSSLDICIYKKGYVPYAIRAVAFTSGGLTLPISQVVDRNYTD